MASVWYIGRALVRTITAAEWAGAGISSATTEWSKTNGYSIPTDSFSAEQLAILGSLPSFDITAPDGPRLDPVYPESPPPSGGGTPVDTSYLIAQMRSEFAAADTVVLTQANQYTDAQAEFPSAVLLFENGIV